MFNFFRKKEKKQFSTDVLGALVFHKVDDTCSWDTLFNLEETGNKIELAIETSSAEPPSVDRIEKLKQFVDSYERLKGQLLSHIWHSFQNSGDPLLVEQLDKMYTLAGVTLKDNGDFWVVLEPGDVASIYNHFIRFTIREGNIEWANIN